MTSARSPIAPSAPKSLSLIFSICALSGAPSNDRARSAGRRGDRLGLGVSVAPAGHAQSLAAIRPPGGRRSDPHSPPPPCIYVFPGDIPSAEAPLATAQPLASVELLAAFHAAFEGREEEHFVDLELAQNGSSRRRRTVIRPRTARNFSRRFWSQVHVTPPTRRRSTGVPSARLYNGPRG